MNNFDDLDKELMDLMKSQREKTVPKKDLEGFREGVIRKISAGKPAAGFSFPAFGFAFMVCAALVGGLVFYVNSMKVEKIPAEETVVTEQAPEIQEMAPLPEVPKAPQPKIIAAPAPLNNQPAAPSISEWVSETDLLDEIEALRELGVWTEEDEAQAGIPVEVTFAEMEAYLETSPVYGVPSTV